MSQEIQSLTGNLQKNLEDKIKKIFKEEGFEKTDVEFGIAYITNNTKVRDIEVKITAKTEPKRIKPLFINTKFAVCINNKGFEATLEVGKLYVVIADAEAESDGMLRVIDEDGEDYLFEAKIFYPLVIPADLAIALHERV